MGANELSNHLWRERELLELLLYKLEVQRLLLANGQTRWIKQASGEVEQVLGHIRAMGLARAVEIATVAEEWGAPEDATLLDLIEKAPTEVWRDILTEHRGVLTTIMTEVAHSKNVNEAHLQAVSRAVEATLHELGAGSGEYTTHGSRARYDSARIVDTEL